MGATTDVATYERTVTIGASPETVWEFFVDPEKAKRWMGIDAQFDTRPGGEYRCVVIPGHTAVGEFVELDKPNRLVFTWGWEGETGVPPGTSTIEVELTPEGDGTTVRFVHRDLPNAEAVASHKTGWDHYLDRLEVAAGGGDPGADPWATDAPQM